MNSDYILDCSHALSVAINYSRTRFSVEFSFALLKWKQDPNVGYHFNIIPHKWFSGVLEEWSFCFFFSKNLFTSLKTFFNKFFGESFIHLRSVSNAFNPIQGILYNLPKVYGKLCLKVWNWYATFISRKCLTKKKCFRYFLEIVLIKAGSGTF